MIIDQVKLRQEHKFEYLAFLAIFAFATIAAGLSLHFFVEAPIHFLIYFPVYICAYLSSIYYANKYSIDPIGWRSDIHVLLMLIGVSIICMLIVYVAHDEVGSIYIAAVFQGLFAHLSFTSAQWHINNRNKRKLKKKVKKGR